MRAFYRWSTNGPIRVSGRHGWRSWRKTRDITLIYLGEETITTYYVATLARYVLVDAENETQARELGHTALHEQYANSRAKWGMEVPIEIRTTRPATSDEIDMVKWHHEMLAREATIKRD